MEAYRDVLPTYESVLRDAVTEQISGEYTDTVSISWSEWENLARTARELFSHHSLKVAPGHITRDTLKWVARSAQHVNGAVDDPVTADALMTGLEEEHRRSVYGEDSVVCLYTTPRDELLLIQRGKTDHAEAWMPPTGRVESGESLEDAAYRETLEEAGVTASFHNIGEAYDDDYRATLHLLAATGPRKTVAAGSDATAAEWVSFDAFDQYSMPPTMEYISKAAPILQDAETPRGTDDGNTDSGVEAGQYKIVEGNGSYPAHVTIFSLENALLYTGANDDGEHYMWLEAFSTLSPAEEEIVQAISNRLVENPDWEQVASGVVH